MALALFCHLKDSILCDPVRTNKRKQTALSLFISLNPVNKQDCDRLKIANVGVTIFCFLILFIVYLLYYLSGDKLYCAVFILSCDIYIYIFFLKKSTKRQKTKILSNHLFV